MKKLLSVILALIFVFSGVTVAFAVDNSCPVCGEEFTAKKYGSADKAETAFNDHIKDGCDGKVYSCRFKCGASFSSEANCKTHERSCLEYDGGTCKDCGTKYKTYGEELDHKCSSSDNSAVGDAADKVVSLIESINWKEVVSTVKKLIEKINFEKMVADFTPILKRIVTFIAEFAEKAQAA
ncbi:MAG: hypothetical protein E7547_03495 [Ruminococcaceae bacterium]|nr:hypothetical protein [Oscillospiraceae bacterium]